MKLKTQFAIREVLGDYMAVAVGANSAQFSGIIRLNESGKRILELLQEGLEPDAVVAALQQEYDAPNEVLSEAVSSLIAQLDEHGFIER